MAMRCDVGNYEGMAMTGLLFDVCVELDFYDGDYCTVIPRDRLDEVIVRLKWACEDTIGLEAGFTLADINNRIANLYKLYALMEEYQNEDAFENLVFV